MARRQRIPGESGWISMKVDKATIETLKGYADAEASSMAGYVAKIIEKDIQRHNGIVEKDEDIRNELNEIKECQKDLVKRLEILNDKIDCINIIVTKLQH